MEPKALVLTTMVSMFIMAKNSAFTGNSTQNAAKTGGDIVEAAWVSFGDSVRITMVNVLPQATGTHGMKTHMSCF
jgi:hypothetical protein